MEQDKTQGANILPEHIRANLAQHAAHENLTCLECGYTGLMGVTQDAKRVSSGKFWTYIAIAYGIIFFINIYLSMKSAPIMPWWLYLIVGGGIWLFTAGSIKTYQCPNCNSQLKRK